MFLADGGTARKGLRGFQPLWAPLRRIGKGPDASPNSGQRSGIFNRIKHKTAFLCAAVGRKQGNSSMACEKAERLLTFFALGLIIKEITCTQLNIPLIKSGGGTGPEMPGNLLFARCQILRENREMRNQLKNLGYTGIFLF